MVRDPKILNGILEELTDRLQRCSRSASDTVRDAEYTQQCALERMRKTWHSANAIRDRTQKDRLAVERAREEVNELLSLTRAAVVTAQKTLGDVEKAKQTSENTLGHWQGQLQAALAWLQRAEARLARAIQARQEAQRACDRAKSNLESARSRLSSCRSDPKRNCSGAASAVNSAQAALSNAQDNLRAAKIEVGLAREEVEQAKARVACCKRAVGYAEQAVAESIIAETHAEQALNSAERSLEEALAAERHVLASDRKATEAEDLTEKMLVEVKAADTLTHEAQISYQKGEKMQETARRYATLGDREIEYRREQLLSLNRTSPNL